MIPWLLGTRIGRALSAALAAAVAVFAVFRLGERSGGSKADIDALKDEQRKGDKGRDAVSNLRGAGRDDLLEQLRRNDGRWK